VGVAETASYSLASLRVVQNGETAQRLGRANVPFQTVSDDTDLGRIDVQGGKHSPERARIGLANADLAFNLDMMETRSQTETLDLGALQWTGAVGEQREPVSSVPQLDQHGVRLGFEPHLPVAMEAEGVGDALCDLGRYRWTTVAPQGLEGFGCDDAPGLLRVCAAHGVAVRIAPEGPPRLRQGARCNVRSEVAKLGLVYLTDAAPRQIRAAIG
jgi:hypothetical protein